MGVYFLVKNMASFEGQGSKVMDKFDGVNFHLSKFKMEIVFVRKRVLEDR